MVLINGSLFVTLGVLIYIISRTIFISRQYKNKTQVYWLKEIFNFSFSLYICLVVSVTLFPIPIGFDQDYKNSFRSINVIPLVSIIKNIGQIGTAYDGDVFFMISLIVRNVGGNILLLMPFGFLVPIVFKNIKGLKPVAILGFSVSVTIEVFQLVESFGGGWGRVTDIDDVIYNVTGVVTGYIIYSFIINTGERFKRGAITKLNM